MSSSAVPNPLGGLPSRVAPAKKQTVDSSWPLAKDTAAASASASASTATATGKKKQQRGQDTDVPPPPNTASTSKKAAQTAAAAAAAAASSSEVPPPPPARGLPSEKKKKTTTAASRFPIIEDEIPIMMDLPSTTKKPAKPQQLPPLSMKDLPSSASLPRSAVAPTKEVPPTTFPDPSMPKPLRLGGQKTDKSAAGAAGGAQKLSDLPEQPGPAPSGSLPTPSSRSAGKKKVTIADVPDQDLPQTQPLRLANATFKPPTGNGAAGTAAEGQTDLKLDTKMEGKVGRKPVGTAAGAGAATLDTPVKSSTKGGKAKKAASDAVEPLDPFNPAPLDAKTAGGKAGKARGVAGAVDPVDPFNPPPLDTKMAGGKSTLDTQPKSSTKGNKTKVTTGSVGYVDPFNPASFDPKTAQGKAGKAKGVAGVVDPADPSNPAPLDTKTPGAKASKANPFRLDPTSATTQATSAQAIPSGSGTGSGPFTRKPLGSPPRTAMQKTPPLGGFPAFPAGTQSKAGQTGTKGSKNPFRPLQGDSQQPQQMGNVATYDDPFGQSAADAYTQQQQDQLQGKPLGQTGAQSVYRPSAVSPPPPAARGTQRTAAKPGFGHAPSSSLDSNDSMGSSATATSSSRPLNGTTATQRGNTTGTYGKPVGGGGYNQAQAVPAQQQPYRQQPQTQTFNQPTAKQPPPPARTRTDEKPYYPNNDPPSEGQTPYMNMLLSLDRIPRLHNILVSFFVWILLAGFIILPGSFTSSKRKEDNATVQIPIGGTSGTSTGTNGNKATTGTGGKLSLTPANTAALVIGFLCLLAGTFGSAWLGLRWRRNYVWLLNKLYMPLTLTCIAGLIATITAVYTQQAGEWGPQAVTTAVVEAVELAISLMLFFVYNYWLLKRVRGEHVDSYDDADLKGMSKKEMRAEKKRRRKEKKAARKAAKGKGRWGSGFFAKFRGVRRKKPYAAGSIV
ncbi:hypothetical protein B0J18DRAFT_476303 [Chaetomium sp. MPI-SDFR-AT-0129]|nr:hypothetical protein B0J18DRAFT_476303 [Chaetomium sp. MPI-SDFR-AT-0129]